MYDLLYQKLMKVDKNTQCIWIVFKSFKYFISKLNNCVASWTASLKNQIVWSNCFRRGTWIVKAIKCSTLKYFGKPWKHWYWSRVFQFRPVTTFENRSNSSNFWVLKEVFSSYDKANINIKGSYSLPIIS